jgi:prolyl-tRNA synthetase
MVTAEAGEDLILASSDGAYAANQERAVSLAPEPIPLPGGPRAGGQGEPLATPGQSSIDALCAGHGIDPSQTVKVLMLLARFEDGSSQPLLVSLRGDQQLNEVKLANAVTARCSAEHGALLEIAPITTESVATEGLMPMPFGFMGPHLADGLLADAGHWIRHFLRLADSTAAELSSFVCGANSADTHLVGAAWGSLCPCPESLDLRAAQPGDRCQHDPSQQLQSSRGIEVGHIFQLGRKYAEALNLTVLDLNGKQVVVTMGSYGIGVSRAVAAIAEATLDDMGLCWPREVAPADIHIVIASKGADTIAEEAERLASELEASGLRILLDDRTSVSPGVKFKDAELIGVPTIVVVGKGLADGVIEVRNRANGERSDVAIGDAVATLRTICGRPGN